jgi:cytochrome c5
LADGSSPWFSDQYFGVKQEVKVTVHIGAKVLATAFTNAFGEFVIPNVSLGTGSITGPSTGPIQVTAEAGGGTASATTTPGQGAPLNLQIRNHRPSITGIATRIAGQQRREVPASGVVNVAADLRDVDGDPVTLTWKAGPANGTLSSATGTTTDWTLPGRPGVMTIYVLANDGKGGIAVASTGVSAGATDATFAIKLLDPSGTVVTKADVTVNGAKANAQPNGLFIGKAPATNRYVVNAIAPGYVFVSRIYNHGDIYHEIKLAPAALSTISNPTGDITLVDTRKNLREYGYVESAPATLHIKRGALLGADKKPPTGPLSAEIAALDVSSEQFPGDNGAMVNGKDIGLVSYGAMNVEIRDGAGNRMQLAKGQSADVIIPVPFQMKNPPAKLPVWYYNEQTGFWEKFAKPAVYDQAKRAYIGEVTHLSAFNIDLEQADLACFRVLLDNVQSGQLKARVSPVSGQTFPVTPFFDIHDQLNVIKRLPPNSVVHIDIQKNDGTPEPDLLLLDENQVVQASGNFPTGPATTPHFPDSPYVNCKTISVRTGLAAPAGVDSVPFLNLYSGEGNQPSTQDYYTHIDASMSHSGAGYSGGDHSTLGAWWNYAGFNVVTPGKPNSAADEARQAYLNFNDLGFGRDMHIRKDSSGHVYAYVSNYTRADGKPDQNPINAVYANDQDQTKVVATVVMEATDFGGMSKVVKFFVYAGDSAASPLIDSADLDGFGQKFVPQLCQVCHGGKPYPFSGTPTTNDYALRTSTGAVGAVFREFDLGTFVYPNDATPGNVGFLSATSMTQFFNLNQHVKDSGTQPVMVTLIDGFNPNASTFHTDFVPSGSGWDVAGVKHDLYADVVGKSCRTCHIAFDPTAVGNNLNWQDYATFTGRKSAITSAVCTDYKYMPHALMTFRNFWLGSLGGPYEPPKLATFTTPEWTPAIGTCQ